MFYIKLKLHRFRHWEYWNAIFFYFPLGFYYVYLAISARSLGFFNATNPSILYGGMALELKSDIEKIIPAKWHPNSILIDTGTKVSIIESMMDAKNIHYPCIGKPDDGSMGRDVEKLHTQADLIAYTQRMKANFLIQSYIDYPNEVGIFYCRLPNEAQGRITGIVEKKGITIVGDGYSSVGELIYYSYRYHYFYQDLFNNKAALRDTILPDGTSLLLQDIGNHARGSTFYDVSHRINTALTKQIDAVSQQIEGFYYGRYDIKFDTWEALEQGKDFTIIELNGAGSLPTHIYDPSHSYWFGIRETARHWKIMYQIAKQNKAKGYSYLNIKALLAMIKQMR